MKTFVQAGRASTLPLLLLPVLFAIFEGCDAAQHGSLQPALKTPPKPRNPPVPRKTGEFVKLTEFLHFDWSTPPLTVEPCAVPQGGTYNRQYFFFLRMWEDPASNPTKRKFTAYLQVSMDDYCTDPNKDFTYPYGCANLSLDGDHLNVTSDGVIASITQPLEFKLEACSGFAYYYNQEAGAATTPPREYCSGTRNEYADTYAYPKSYLGAVWNGPTFDYSDYDCCTQQGKFLKGVTNQLTGVTIRIEKLAVGCIPRGDPEIKLLPTCDENRSSFFSAGVGCAINPGEYCSGAPALGGYLYNPGPPAQIYASIDFNIDGVQRQRRG